MSKVKVFILADSVEEYQQAVDRCLEEDETFMEHEPEWFTGVELTKVESYSKVEFINARECDTKLIDRGYEVSYI